MIDKEITMGNFFSGSGTWELAAELAGMKVLFESEIEPFPVALEAKRFPNAIQLGDITKVNGNEIPIVDVLTNSSPCQDLSVAGKRQAMVEGSGTRSSLFYEVIRITKEMREHDRRIRGTDQHIRPRFWCWENVPGAFSSNKGEDFRAVIEAVESIVEEEPDVPMPDKGKWANAGVVDGNGWQIAWRLEDAQFWGVPQRRKRIFLVADFDGHRAGEVLFEQEGLHWDFETIRKAWQTSSSSLEERIDEARRCLRDGYGKNY